MSLIPVEYHGIRTTGPEQFTCVILRWAEQNRILPIWISPLAAAEIEVRDSGYSPRRPGTHELLADALTRLGTGVTAITITSYFEGTFIASIVMKDGEELDARASDALILARMLELDVKVEEDVLTQASFFVSDEDLHDYLHLQVTDLPAAQEDLSASGDAQADADFEEMMRSLGMSDKDFLSQTDSDTDSDTDSEEESDEGGDEGK